ncbi:MAG: hypothetical protein WCF31_05065, partial [Candidatus Deferrimicrobiaceae bacterium]
GGLFLLLAEEGTFDVRGGLVRRLDLSGRLLRERLLCLFLRGGGFFRGRGRHRFGLMLPAQNSFESGVDLFLLQGGGRRLFRGRRLRRFGLTLPAQNALESGVDLTPWLQGRFLFRLLENCPKIEVFFLCR